MHIYIIFNYETKCIVIMTSDISITEEIEQKNVRFKYTNNAQTIKVGTPIIPSLPLEIKKLDLQLVWKITPKLENGLQLNKYTGTISGRIVEKTDTGTFDYTIDAISDEYHYISTFTITIKEREIETVKYPNNGFFTLPKHKPIKPDIIPVIIGSYPHSFEIVPSLPYKYDNLPNGIIFNDKNGSFSGTPTEIIKSTWQVKVRNNANEYITHIMLFNIIQDSSDLNKNIRQRFTIPQNIFKPMNLQDSFNAFVSNKITNSISLNEFYIILLSLGKTPNYMEVKQKFIQYSENQLYLSWEELNECLTNEVIMDTDIDLKKISAYLMKFDRKKLGVIRRRTFKDIMDRNGPVLDEIQKDIMQTIDRHNNAKSHHKYLVQLYRKLSHGINNKNGVSTIPENEIQNGSTNINTNGVNEWFPKDSNPINGALSQGSKVGSININDNNVDRNEDMTKVEES